MSQSNPEHIKQITNAIDIDPQKQLLLNGKIVETQHGDMYATEPSGKMIFDALHQLIYRQFYIQPCEPGSNELPTPASLREHLRAVSVSNKSIDKFDVGWLVDKKEEEDILVARKGNRIKKLLPGEFLYDHRVKEKENTHRRARFFLPKEYGHPEEIFYYAYGMTAMDNDEDCWIRFYFNNTFEGNRQLVNLFTVYLNQFAVPFIFKCLIHPFYYGRSDTAVLYCNKQYAAFIIDYLKNIHHEINGSLRDSLPLFVFPVERGIGFAEQPLNGNESFGSHWSKIIAAGMMNAWENKLDKEKWPEEVLKHIRQNHGYKNPQHFYKNPGSHYPYTFIDE
jgi:hypothetical protein